MSGMDGEQEKRQFNYPKREDIIEQIKELDDEIEHVSLNLIKCDFNATEKDVEKAFPEFRFLKVKNYNPGSFEVLLEMKIDAINFIRNCYDRKILTRRFYIKLGRQHKEVLEDWACVGYVPRKPHPKKPFQKGPHDRKPRGEGKPDEAKKEEEKPKQGDKDAQTTKAEKESEKQPVEQPVKKEKEEKEPAAEEKRK